MNSSHTSLTRHSEGSLKELLSLSWPLMLSSLSVMLMIFVDRLLLAHYSKEALNAVVNASTFSWTFILFFMVLTQISEVFVAQYNGAGRQKKLGGATWQMIWLSFLSAGFFLPLSIWGTDFFYGPTAALEGDYFRYATSFGPIYALYGALSGFFIGQGRVRLISYLAFAANMINFIFDYLLIFGAFGLIPAMGVKGAAIATNIGSLFQVIILFIFFLSSRNRLLCCTGNWKLEWPQFAASLAVGLPRASFTFVEMLGFATYYWLMTLAGDLYITIAGICQTVVILLCFIIDGLGSATTVIAGNRIGAKRRELVRATLQAGIGLLSCFLALMLAVFFLFSRQIIGQFLPHATPEQLASYLDPLFFCLLSTFFYLFVQGIRKLLAGVLIAGGDTLFLFISGGAIIWLLYVLPAFLGVVQSGWPVESTAVICLIYSGAGALLNWARYRQESWQRALLASV